MSRERMPYDEVDLGVCRAARFDRGTDRWTVLLPGANYPVTAPLLWFAREAALDAGSGVLAVMDRYDRSTDPETWVRQRGEAALRHLDGASERVLVGKSISTLAASLAAELELPAAWLTPLINSDGTSVAGTVVDALSAASARFLLVGGAADPTWDVAVARSFMRGTVLEVGDANHQLEVPGRPDATLAALGRVRRALRRFIGAEAAGGMPVGLDHVQLAMPAGGEDQARVFYGDLLGLSEVAKPAGLAARGGCWFVGGGLHLHLGVAEPFAPAGTAHPGLLVDDLEALRRRLMAAGIEIIDDSALPGVARSYARDPFGNRLEFIAAEDGGFTGRPDGASSVPGEA